MQDNRIRALFATAAIVCLGLVGIHGTTSAQEAAKAEDGVQLIIRFHSKREHLSEFTDIMRGVETAMRKEKGFVSAIVYQDYDDPRAFTLIEEWGSRQLHEEHFERIVESGDWAHILGLLTTEPVMSYNRTLPAT